MSTFTATKRAEAVVEAEAGQIWAVLSDPVLVARLTRFVKRIDVDGDLWHWQLSGLEILGKPLSPSFTERMNFDEPARIEFSHEAGGRGESAGVDGWYSLEPTGDGATTLVTEMSICIEAPLPRLAGPAVERVMRSVLDSMGDGFSANLLRHLGAPQR